jgi:uncharacterized alpha/beta hydrolase family protein
MKPCLLLALLSCAVIFQACDSSSSKDKVEVKPQTIITSDSSELTGRLYVRCYNGSATVSGAMVSLFVTYDDLKRSLPLLTIQSASDGMVDMGYVLTGNYYIAGSTGSGVLLRDTTVAQILPQRSVTRNLYLH